MMINWVSGLKRLGGIPATLYPDDAESENSSFTVKNLLVLNIGASCRDDEQSLCRRGFSVCYIIVACCSCFFKPGSSYFNSRTPYIVLWCNSSNLDFPYAIALKDEAPLWLQKPTVVESSGRLELFGRALSI
jgi:hypothetical protein